MHHRLRHRFITHILLILGLVVTGAIGYMLIEHWSFLDALFMTTTTLTTVGYGEVHPLTPGGQLYTMALILVGVGLLLYILSEIAELIVEANPTAILGKRRMRERISKLSDHQIVCGYGRTGQEVTEHFMQNNVSFVIIESDLGRARQAEENGHLVLVGDATEDKVLLQAQIGKATGIVCSLPDDAANTFITLAAKGLNEKIAVVCRAANPGSEARMERAGAHKVISPYVICGKRMATAVTHPLVMEFLDVAMHSPAYDLRLEQIIINSPSQLAGMSLKEANIKHVSGAMVLAVKQQGKLITNPQPDLIFQAKDELIVLGAEQELQKLYELAGSNKQ